MSSEVEENIRKEYVEKVKEGIEYCRVRNEPIIGRKDDIVFSVSDENLFEISFSNKGKSTHIVIDEEGTYSEFEAVKEETNISYYRNRKLDKPIKLVRVVRIINGEEVNEYYSITSEGQDEIQAEMLQEILNNHREYSKGEDGEFCREGINPNENERRIKHSDLQGFFIVESMGSEATTYDKYLEAAKEFEGRCKEIYEWFMEAYKELGIKSEKAKLDEQLKQEEADELEI